MSEVKLRTGLFEPARTGCHGGKVGLGHNGQDGWYPVSAWKAWCGKPCHKRSGPKGQLDSSDILGRSVETMAVPEKAPQTQNCVCK